MRILLAALASALLALTLAGSARAQSTSLPASAAPMSAPDVYQIYAGRTWTWPDGAAFFARDRKFVAWSGTGDTSSYAEGRWLLTDRGRLCWEADWHGAGWTMHDSTCFSHRVVDETIYQRKDPNGAWYIFRHSPSAADDEFAKLGRGDLVTKTYCQIKKSLAHMK